MSSNVPHSTEETHVIRDVTDVCLNPRCFMLKIYVNTEERIETGMITDGSRCQERRNEQASFQGEKGSSLFIEIRMV